MKVQGIAPRRSIVIASFGFVAASVVRARAGMAVYELTDLTQMRLQDISFFLFLLALAALGTRFLWNYLARDFPRLPKLSFLKALSLTLLIGVSMVLVLAMISGAREVLTPEAWTRQGSHYRPNDIGNRELREQSMDALRSALLMYAQSHNGRFPPHDYVPEIPAKLWEAPDRTGTRYVYPGALNKGLTNGILACEPKNFGDERLVLFPDGKVSWLKTEQIHRLLQGSILP